MPFANIFLSTNLEKRMKERKTTPESTTKWEVYLYCCHHRYRRLSDKNVKVLIQVSSLEIKLRHKNCV